MINIGVLKKILESKGVYLAESLEGLRAMVTSKFPGLSDKEINEVIQEIKQQSVMEVGRNENI
ncbi:MAG: hypothetical protein HFI13_15305 [Lachnospiraceae bacterium]|nr:hypothetical protein [Lachnospiraceae bacterium]